MRYKFIESINWTNNWIFVWPDLAGPFSTTLITAGPLSHVSILSTQNFHEFGKYQLICTAGGTTVLRTSPLPMNCPFFRDGVWIKWMCSTMLRDWCLHEEPDLITFVLVQRMRDGVSLCTEQKSELSSNRLDP